MRYLLTVYTHTTFPCYCQSVSDEFQVLPVTSGSVVPPPSAFTASCCWKGVERRELKPPRVPLQRRGPAQVASGILTFLVGGLQPYVKNMSQNLESSPNFGVKIQK